MKASREVRTTGFSGATALMWSCALVLASCSATRSVDEVLQRSESAPVEQGVAAPLPKAAPATEAATPSDSSAVGETEAIPSGPAEALAPVDPLDLARLASQRLEESTETCTALLPSARAEDASYEVLMAASRALILNADLRLQSTLALQAGPGPAAPPEVLIDLEDDVSRELKSEIRSLATGSAGFAQRALALRPGDPAAELFSTLGTGLRLWSLPTLQALASGAATTLPGQIKRLAAASPDFEGASPLRLKGRFQSRAPWPFKDLEKGRDTLAAAVETASKFTRLLRSTKMLSHSS